LSLKREIVGRNFNFNGAWENCTAKNLIRKLSGNYNSGVWGQSPQPPEATGVVGAEPPTLRRFFSFFKNKSIFKHILG